MVQQEGTRCESARAFVQDPVASLISPRHASALRASIRADEATPSAQIKGNLGPAEGTDTTDYSVVDTHGNAVDG